MKKVILLGMCLILCLGLCSCSNKEEKVEDIELSSEDLVEILKNSRSDSENSLYEVQSGIENTVYLNEMGIIDTKKIQDSAISLTTENKSYCIAIFKSNDVDSFDSIFKEYSAKRKDELYTNFYSESLIAEKYQIRKLENFVVFVMSEDSETLCENIENNLILKINEVRG